MYDDPSSSYRGREGTYAKTSARYYWKGLYEDVKGYVRTCPECRKRDRARLNTMELHPTYGRLIRERWFLNVVKIDASRCLVVARDSLSRWPEARIFEKDASLSQIARFIYKDIIIRFGVPRAIGMDGGPENTKDVITLLANYDIHLSRILAYYP
jgi:hypothetical protein